MKYLWKSKELKIKNQKNKKTNKTGSSLCVLQKRIDFLDNIPKHSYIIFQLFVCSAKWICFYCQVFHNYYNFKPNKPSASCNFIKYFFYLLEVLSTSFIYKRFICFVKEFFLTDSFIGAFWGILRKVTQQIPRKTRLIFGIFSFILSLCFCHLVVNYLTKLWNLWSLSHIYLLFWMLRSVFGRCYSQYDSICKEF